MHIEQVVFIYLETHVHTHKYANIDATNIKEKEAMNLKQSKGECTLQGLERRKGRRK